MSCPMTRAVCRLLKGRLYSVEAARKIESTSLLQTETATSRVNGMNVVAAENHSPVSRLVFVAKAGSRFEDPTNLGVTHLIRHISYLTNSSHSSFKTVKTIEELGASFNTLTTRDYAMLSVSCTRDNLSEVFAIAAPAFSRSMFDPWDWRDAPHNPRVEFDVASLCENPHVELMEHLHAAAFRENLANSLYCSPSFVGSHSAQQVLDFISAHYRPNRMAVVGSGVDIDQLSTMVGQMKFANTNLKANDAKAVYKGGEKRVPRPDLELTYAAVVTEGPSMSSKDLLVAAVLQAIMGIGPRIKYSDGITGHKLATAVQKVTNTEFMVNGLNVNYTDSGLFGFTVAAQPSEMEKVLRTAFAEFALLTKVGLTDEEVSRGKNELRADISMNMENGDNNIMNLAEQAVGSEQLVSVSDVLAFVDSIQTSDVISVAKKLVNGKPSMAAVGNLSNVPYLDQLLK